MAAQKPMGSRPYDPATGRTKRRTPPDQTNPQRAAWFQNYALYLDLFVAPNEDAVEGTLTGTPDLVLSITKPSQPHRKVSIGLVTMTEEELLGLKRIIDYAFEQALPIVQERDRVASDIFQDDSREPLKRSYRASPVVVVREGKIPAYQQSIRERLAAAAEGASTAGDPDGGDGPELREAGDSVAQQVPPADRTDDDSSAADQPA